MALRPTSNFGPRAKPSDVGPSASLPVAAIKIILG